MRIFKRGTKVEIAQQEWFITAAIIRSESDVKYMLSRNTQTGRQQVVVYPFEFNVLDGKKQNVDLIDMGELA